MMSNAFLRFVRAGLLDADQRLARALEPKPTIAADRYLASSAAVRFCERIFHQASQWWSSSVAHVVLVQLSGSSRAAADRYRQVGLLLLIGAGTHVLLTIAQGPRPGWFWMLIPVMASVIGALLLMAPGSAADQP